ncbi:MAG: hypothetical protein JJU28_06625 [Cyclobacteriaceae bacterium]|nr:hypothetical protein [Cyclobacteriaceae bacterium]
MNFYRSKSALRFNPLLYAALVLVSLLHFFVFNDFMSGVITLNLALAFDPFYQKQTWSERPLWQRTWLIVHVCFGIGILFFLAAQKIWF